MKIENEDDIKQSAKKYNICYDLVLEMYKTANDLKQFYEMCEIYISERVKI